MLQTWGRWIWQVRPRSIAIMKLRPGQYCCRNRMTWARIVRHSSPFRVSVLEKRGTFVIDGMPFHSTEVVSRFPAWRGPLALSSCILIDLTLAFAPCMSSYEFNCLRATRTSDQNGMAISKTVPLPNCCIILVLHCTVKNISDTVHHPTSPNLQQNSRAAAYTDCSSIPQRLESFRPTSRCSASPFQA